MELKRYDYRYDGGDIGNIYAYNKKDAIKRYKERYNHKKLPNGFEIWEGELI